MKWRFIDSGIAAAAENMAVDEALLQTQQSGEVPPTLRFYGWRPAAVSVGYFQKATQEIDGDECKKRGIDVVRRLTGGRAVLHDQELTYSIVVREHHADIPPTITASYRYLSGGILTGLQRLGVDAQMSIPRGAYGQRRLQRGSAACFDAPSHYEVTCGGRKLVGSAQVRKNGVILQHGSILIKFSAQLLAAVLKVPSPEARQSLIAMLERRVVSLDEILARDVTRQELVSVLRQAFSETLDAKLEPSGLTQRETALAKQLAAAKYSQDQWNLLR